MSPGGDNVLRYVRYIDSESADYFNFGDGAGYKLMTGEGRSTVFSDISVDSTGLIFALDQTYGKVFIYDQNCNSLSIFGTGLGQGPRRVPLFCRWRWSTTATMFWYSTKIKIP